MGFQEVGFPGDNIVFQCCGVALIDFLVALRSLADVSDFACCSCGW